VIPLLHTGHIPDMTSNVFSGTLNLTQSLRAISERFRGAARQSTIQIHVYFTFLTLLQAGIPPRYVIKATVST